MCVYVHLYASVCVYACVLRLQRKNPFESGACNQSLLNEGMVCTLLTDSRGKAECAPCFLEDVTHVCTHVDDKEEVFIPIGAVFDTGITHTDSRVLVLVRAQIKNARATCNAGFINYYQLLYINKPWHKSSDESATPNTLETLPRLAYYRPAGKIGRRGRWGATGDRDKEHRGGGEARQGNGERGGKAN